MNIFTFIFTCPKSTQIQMYVISDRKRHSDLQVVPNEGKEN